jgi:hypothetical protein
MLSRKQVARRPGSPLPSAARVISLRPRLQNTSDSRRPIQDFEREIVDAFLSLGGDGALGGQPVIDDPVGDGVGGCHETSHDRSRSSHSCRPPAQAWRKTRLLNSTSSSSSCKVNDGMAIGRLRPGSAMACAILVLAFSSHPSRRLPPPWIPTLLQDICLDSHMARRSLSAPRASHFSQLAVETVSLR